MLKRASGGDASPPWYVRNEARSMGHVGPLMGHTMGRSDKIATHVPDGAHILPADTVSALGDGNSQAGHYKLGQMFPASMKQAKPVVPKLPNVPGIKLAGGGASRGTVPVMLSDGEFSVHPSDVKRIGGGDEEHGHRILDAFIKHIREKYATKLKTLPGPSK